MANIPSQLISSRYKPGSFVMKVSMLKAVLKVEGHVAWWLVNNLDGYFFQGFSVAVL